MRHSPHCHVLLLLLPLALGGCGGNHDPEEEPQVADACRVLTDAGGSVTVGSGLPGDPAAPEAASGYRLGRKVVTTASYMVVTANPLASKAGCEVLQRGGSAVDAAVAVQAVLGLVEPQSSGLGGGAFMLHHQAADKSLVAYDGRETAPAAATPNHLRWIDDETNRSAPLPTARASGRAIGTPGVLRMLETAHAAHGKRPWKELFDPAIRLASDGFPIGGRMAAALESARTAFARDADAVAAYYHADGSPKALGTTLRLPEYAETLRAVADGGAQAFYTGAIAADIVAEINRTTGADGSTLTPGKTTLADLSGYRAKARTPVCSNYRRWQVCGMPPPSSGGLAVAQTLGILETFDLAPLRPTAIDLEGGKPTVAAVHLVSEAQRLAYADRDRYVADSDFVPLPGRGVESMLDKSYLRSRADLISLSRSLGRAQPGTFPAATPQASQPAGRENGTSHVTIVDAQGNVVSMTTTVESAFGAWRMVRGVVLNNQLTDFSADPADDQGTPIANRVEPGKRPRSSMAPTIVFGLDAGGGRGDLLMATGSPGGSTIIQYVTKTLVGVLDWGLDAQQATNLVDFGAANTPTTNVGGEHPNVNANAGGDADPLVIGLRALGHTVNVNAQSSGISTIVKVSRDGQTRLTGGADPRREGLALGDPVRP